MEDVFTQSDKKHPLRKKLQIYYSKKQDTMKEFIHPKFQNIICAKSNEGNLNQKNDDMSDLVDDIFDD